MRLTNLYVMRRVVALGYPVLESVLSTIDICDDAILCVDPASGDDTVKLAHAVSRRYPKASVIEYVWPEYSMDGSAIGMATQFALENATGDYCLNVQSDELYPAPLMEYLRDHWKTLVRYAECFSLKVLNTEHNIQQFQGGEQWNGEKYGDVWERGGMFNGKDRGGAGYNRAIKLFKNCKSCGRIRVAHDGWSMDGCSSLHHLELSEVYPIIHAHDMMRDHLIDIRRNAADRLWQDRSRFGHYAATADSIEATRDEWWGDPKWTRTTSPFWNLLPPVAQRLIGKTRYEIDWGLLQ